MRNPPETKGICQSNRGLHKARELRSSRTDIETHMTARPTFFHLEVPSDAGDGATFPLEMQPIVQIDDGRVKAWELLYRGPQPADWTKVDAAVLRFLSTPRALPPIFINLSNDSLIAHDASAFFNVAIANDVTFELSEAVSGYADRDAIAAKVNELIDGGARVALDDFGAGRDGLERLYALRDVAAVKIDREFVLTCMRRQDARRMLAMLVSQWRRDGIKSIAEGIETGEMFAFAKAIDVDCVQGYFVDGLVGMTLTDGGY
jgi:EAL domain-containing protein (putative c-di-GMP-specific phosphodiesterase class I)